jgi:hypothetical protein
LRCDPVGHLAGSPTKLTARRKQFKALFETLPTSKPEYPAPVTYWQVGLGTGSKG